MTKDLVEWEITKKSETSTAQGDGVANCLERIAAAMHFAAWFQPASDGVVNRCSCVQFLCRYGQRLHAKSRQNRNRPGGGFLVKIYIPRVSPVGFLLLSPNFPCASLNSFSPRQPTIHSSDRIHKPKHYHIQRNVTTSRPDQQQTPCPNCRLSILPHKLIQLFSC